MWPSASLVRVARRFGELLSDSRSANPAVVRSVTAVTLPDGRIWFATGDSRGTVQLWDGAQGVMSGRPILSGAGPVWSMTALTVPGPTAVLFTGDDDGRIRRGDVETGEPAGEPFGDDGRSMLLTGADDGTVRCWDAETG